MTKQQKNATWVIVICLLTTAAFLIWWPKEKPKTTATTEKPKVVSRPISAEEKDWVLCWEKKPGHVGRTTARKKCLRVEIIKKTPDTFIAKTFYNGGTGLREGYSRDGGKTYEGVWRDSTGWGRWKLTFITSSTAYGWANDEGKGKRAYCTLTVN